MRYNSSQQKKQTPQEEVRKSHEKYEIRILYFSCKYEYNICNKHLKQAPKTHEHKCSSHKPIQSLTRNGKGIIL